MIPKLIHYCWFGGNELPPMYQRCIDSWKKNLSDFEIIRWDESNTLFDTPFLRDCVRKKQWAFISDYIRMRAIYNHGGVYLDCDMEIIKDISPLLNNHCFMGYEARNRPTSGVIGSTPKHSFPERCMDIVNTRHKDNKAYLIAPEVVILALSTQPSHEHTTIYDENYFYPYNPYDTYRKCSTLMFSDITEKTYAIHHWGKSWNQSIIERAIKKIEKIIRN